MFYQMKNPLKFYSKSNIFFFNDFYFYSENRLAKKLYVRDDELFVKEMEFYPTLEDLIKSVNKTNI